MEDTSSFFYLTGKNAIILKATANQVVREAWCGVIVIQRIKKQLNKVHDGWRAFRKDGRDSCHRKM